MKTEQNTKAIENLRKEIIFQATVIRKSIALSAIENALYTGLLDLQLYLHCKNEIEKRVIKIFKDNKINEI